MGNPALPCDADYYDAATNTTLFDETDDDGCRTLLRCEQIGGKPGPHLKQFREAGKASHVCQLLDVSEEAKQFMKKVAKQFRDHELQISDVSQTKLEFMNSKKTKEPLAKKTQSGTQESKGQEGSERETCGVQRR